MKTLVVTLALGALVGPALVPFARAQNIDPARARAIQECMARQNRIRMIHTIAEAGSCTIIKRAWRSAANRNDTPTSHPGRICPDHRRRARALTDSIRSSRRTADPARLLPAVLARAPRRFALFVCLFCGSALVMARH